MSEDERFQAICDLAAARLATILELEDKGVRDIGELERSNILHDLREIVRLTEKTWR